MSDASSALLRELGLPTGDLHERPPSALTFADGGQYRIEIPSVEGVEATLAALDEAARRDVTVHRLSSGSGITLLSDGELRDLVQIGADAGVEICQFVGPRAPWEGTASSLTPDGGQIGWRHTGMDQLRYALKDVERAVDAGLRSVLLADEGLISVVARGRDKGYFPAELVIKGSAILGIGNAAGLQILRGLGMDTMNVPSDLSIAKLAAARQSTDMAIDLYIESPDALGGFLRYGEIAEIVRVAAPINLKFGLRNAPAPYPSGGHLQQVAISSTRERVRRASIGLEHLQRSVEKFAESGLDRQRPGVPRL